MKKSFIVGRQILKGCLRARSLSLVAFYLISLVAFMAMISASDSAYRTALIIDSGLSLVNIFTILLVLFIILPVFQHEKEKHILAVRMSFDLSRSQYLWGVWLGSTGALIVNFISMAVLLVITFLCMQIEITSGIFRHLFLNLCELISLGTFAIAFSVFFSYVVSAMLTFVFYIVGHMTIAFQQALQGWHDSWVGTVLSFVWNIIPNLSLFNLKDIVIKKAEIPWAYELVALIYAAAMVFLVIEITRFKFERERLL